MSTLVRHHDRLVAMHGNLVKFPDFCFTFNIDTTKGNGFSSFKLPFTSNGITNCYVDFGDDTGWIHITSYNQAETLHPYSAGGVKTVKIKGEVSWSFNNTGDCQKLTYIHKWGNTKFNYLYAGFYGCINLSYVPQLGSIYAPTITTLNSVFRNTTNLTCSIPPNIFDLCVNVTDIATALQSSGVTGLLPNTLLKKLTKLVAASSLLNSCTGLTGSIPEDFIWGLNSLTNISYMFVNTRFTGQIPQKLLWYSPNITNIQGLFQYVNTLTGSIPTGFLMYVTLLTEVSAAFGNATGLSGLFPADFFDYTPNLKYVNRLLESCVNFNVSQFNIPISLIPNILSFERMMYTTTTTGKFTGTIQDIWTYASPSANKLNCFAGQTLLTNYNDIPNEWKGL